MAGLPRPACDRCPHMIAAQGPRGRTACRIYSARSTGKATRCGNLRNFLQTVPCRPWLFHDQFSRTLLPASLVAPVVPTGFQPGEAPESPPPPRTILRQEFWRAGLWACRHPSSRPDRGPADLEQLPPTASTILGERSKGKG